MILTVSYDINDVFNVRKYEFAYHLAQIWIFPQKPKIKQDHCEI